jgi:hypothetical protein
MEECWNWPGFTSGHSPSWNYKRPKTIEFDTPAAKVASGPVVVFVSHLR